MTVSPRRSNRNKGKAAAITTTADMDQTVLNHRPPSIQEVQDEEHGSRAASPSQDRRERNDQEVSNQEMDDHTLEVALREQELARAQREAETQAKLASTEQRLAATLQRIQQLEAAAATSITVAPGRAQSPGEVATVLNGNTQPPAAPTVAEDPVPPNTIASLNSFVENLRAQLDRMTDDRRLGESHFLARSRRRRPHPAELDEDEDDERPEPQRPHLTTDDQTTDQEDAAEQAPLIPGLSADASAAAIKLMANKNHPAHSLTFSEISKLRLKNRTDGPTPSKKLDIGDADHYQHWEHSLNQRWTVNWASYLTDSEKITYALGWLDGNLFTSLEEWWTDSSIANKAFPDFLFEVQTMLGVQFQPTDARRELELTIQRKDESVSQYYARLRTLWHRAKTPEPDRLFKLRSSLAPAFSNALLGRKFDSSKDCYLALLDIENEIKARNLERQRANPETKSRDKPSSGFSKSSSNNTPNHSASYSAKGPSSEPRDDHIPSAAEKAHNASFPPCSQKPAGWMGFFWKPQSHPKRANSTNAHRLLSAQGRCWGCRGSGHMSTDACCPFYDKNNKGSAPSNNNGSRSSKTVSAIHANAPASASTSNAAAAGDVQVATSDDE